MKKRPSITSKTPRQFSIPGGMTNDPPALGFPEPPNVSLRLISVRFPFFWAQMDAVVLAVYVSLSISWLAGVICGRRFDRRARNLGKFFMFVG